MKTPHPCSFRAAAFAVAGALFVPFASLAQNARLDDAFSDGERATQSLPASAAWYTSAASANLTVSSQALVFPGDGAAAQHIVTYFTPSGSPQMLGVGDTLTLSFNFTPSTPIAANSGWRFGLFNSGGSRVTADNLTTGHANYSAWTGYAAMVNPVSTLGAQFYERNLTGSTLIASTTAYSALGSVSASQSFSSGVTYTCIMTVTRTASGVDLVASFSGGSLSNYTVSVSDTSSAFTSFDAFAMAINRNGATPAFASLTIDNVYVAYSPLLDDQFADGERATQNFPTSAAWITSAAGTSLTVSSQQLVFPGDTTNPQHIVTYFTPSGSPKAIGVNERLTTTFSFKVTAPIDASNGWRLGVFNSGGTRVTTDAQTTAHANFNAWTGYAAMVSPGGTTSGNVYERTGTNNTLIASTTAFTAIGASTASQAFTAGTTYTGRFNLSRTASGLAVSLNFSGGAISSYQLAASDASPTATSFDALAMTINRSGTTPAVGSLTLDNVVVEHAFLQPLTVTGVTASNKVYDGTTTATLNTGSAALSGLAAGETVTLNTAGATGAFATDIVGAGKTVNVTGLTLGGTHAWKYYIASATTTANITAKTLTVAGLTAADKAYDGTTAATLNTGSAALVGVVGGDTVTLSTGSATGTFSSAVVGTGKTVTVAGLALSGADASNYALVQPTTTANITQRTLTVAGITADEKVYDGTAAATIDASGATLSGIVGAEVVTLNAGSATGAFTSDGAGVGKTVNISGLTLSGTHAANYTLGAPQATATADINAKDLTVTGITASNKFYDGTTAATLNTAGATLNGVIAGDTVTLSTAGAAGTFSDPEIGVGKLVTITGLTISGADAANYALSQPTATASITSSSSSILADTFSDGERAIQSLPTTSAWYTSAASSGLAVSSQKLVFSGDANSPQHIITYFTASGAPHALSVGQSLTLTFTVTPTAPISLARGWRFGLFNSNGVRVTSDNLTTTHANYTNWTGYTAWLNPGANATGVELAERTAASTNLITGQSAYTILGTAAASQTLSAGTTYTGTFTVSRTSSGISLTVNLSGGTLSNYTLSASDSTPATTSFDAIAMAINRQSTPTTVPAFGSLSLDNISVSAGTAPPTAGSVLTPYEMLGNPVFGATQGDLNEARATKSTFTVMKTGRLYRFAVQTQGLRPNAEWGDLHSKGTGGSYHVRVYSPAAGGSVASTGGSASGNPQGNMTLLGGTQTAWHPGKTVGSFQAPNNAWTRETGQGSAYTANQSIPDSVTEYVGGAQIQSWVVRTRATEDVTGDAPAAFLSGGGRAIVTSIVWVDLYDTTGAAGIPVTQGQVICVSQENQDGSPTANFAHNNEAHCAYAPLPGYGVATPLDPAAGVFYNNGNRDWRKLPHFSVEIDGTWYGQPVYFRDGNNSHDDNLNNNGAARLLYDGRYARQIITPPSGYNRTMNKLWVHAVRFTGKSGYTDANGRLQVRILRATVGTSTFTQYWPASGWATFAAGTFGAQASVTTGGAPSSGSGKITDPTELAKLLKYGSQTLPSLAISGSYHYAIELRVDPATPNAAFYTQATFSPYYIYNRDRPTGRPVLNAPNILPNGNSGQSYNRAEISNNSGGSWESFRKMVPGQEQSASTSLRVFPIALQPDPL